MNCQNGGEDKMEFIPFLGKHLSDIEREQINRKSEYLINYD